MGNTGGDNRVEFGTRLDHALWYESPKFGGGFQFNALFAPGQNRLQHQRQCRLGAIPIAPAATLLKRRELTKLPVTTARSATR